MKARFYIGIVLLLVVVGCNTPPPVGHPLTEGDGLPHEVCLELAEIAEHLGLSDRYKMKKKYIDPLLGRYLEMTLSETPNSPAQRYVLTEEGKAMA